MVTEQIMSRPVAKAVAETMRAAIQAMAKTAAEWPQGMAGPKTDGPAMKQPTFNWDSEDKYSKLKTFKHEINNILFTYNTSEVEQLAMVKNWLGKKGLPFLETLMNAEKVTCDMLEGLFYMLNSKFRPQFNETIKSSHCSSENCVGMMGRM